MQPAIYQCGEFRVEVANRRFAHGDREIRLEPRVFAVILQLLVRAGQLVSRNELLDAVWGHRYVTPSTLNRTIALARRAFQDESDKPRFVQTVHGAGYRFIGPIDIDSTDGTPLQARFGPPPIARLPARIERLIGRENELHALADMLAAARAVTVVGTGGMGKTQCALEAARRVEPGFPDGVWFFDLAPLASADEWVRAVGAALALPESAPEDQIDSICRLMQGRNALLVLDNCDRIAPQVGARVFQVLRNTDSIRCLATSQAPLNLAGERLLRIAPLVLPERDDRGQFEFEGVAGAPAVEMLLSRVRGTLPEFTLDADNAAMVAEICVRLDGMPLALELAAARFSLLSPEQILDRLVQRFRFLSSDSAGRDPRHHNLLALLDWSYALLSAEEQRLLNWFGVFVQTWTMEAAIDAVAALGLGAEAVVDLLGGLVHRSLVSVIPATMPPRYRLLESVRDYALSRLAASGEEQSARLAHLHAVQRMCRAAHADILDGRMRDRIEQLIHEHGNIASALQTAARSMEHISTAMDIVGSLVLYAKAHGAYLTVARWCRDVLPVAESLRTAERARALLTFGVVQLHLNASGRVTDGVLPEAARIAAEQADWWTEAYANGYNALLLANAGEPDAAEPCAALTESLATAHGDDLLTGIARLARGWIRLARGDTTGALHDLCAARVGVDLHHHHFVNMYIGLTQFALGEVSAAARSWLQALKESALVTNIRGTAGSIEGCGYIACRRGMWPIGARLLSAAAQIRERTGVPVFSFWIPYQRAAQAALRASLTPADHAEAARAGAALRQEDAINEALPLLQAFAAESS